MSGKGWEASIHAFDTMVFLTKNSYKFKKGNDNKSTIYAVDKSLPKHIRKPLKYAFYKPYERMEKEFAGIVLRRVEQWGTDGGGGRCWVTLYDKLKAQIATISSDKDVSPLVLQMSYVMITRS